MSEEDLQHFHNLFIAAVAAVPEDYRQTVHYDVRQLLPRIENRGQRYNLKRKLIGDHLIKSGERIFCYELYHRLRLAMIADNGPEIYEGLHLQGELQKQQIQPLLERMGLLALSANFAPDFLLHTPGNANNHPYVVEVKTIRFLESEMVEDDIKKIVEFMTRYGYQRGIFLSVNFDYQRLTEMINGNAALPLIEGIQDVASRIYIIGQQHFDGSVFSHTLQQLLGWV
ncbi:hypothetical protein DYU05_20620 [Mucilaginibacter terrenus]|uniref:Uncharacterized protein n=1 Tax=Mucilaginibacter terrenus TaxID=2482727 RepID=A0A3E2NJ43_9SPHI|nr:hypothetical protein [Mucilaginibacter terrenus]RFZ81027.1 hypothetical protein DYU05_20620 [Mucilaginibacter terrenus]